MRRFVAVELGHPLLSLTRVVVVADGPVSAASCAVDSPSAVVVLEVVGLVVVVGVAVTAPAVNAGLAPLEVMSG